MLHIYYGNGKGKTTAAIGLSIRQVGARNSVSFAQFLKDGTSSEVTVLKKLQVSYMHTQMPKCFFKDMSKQEQERLQYACQQVLEDAFATTSDCVILDELLDVIDLGLVQEEVVLSYVQTYSHKEIVLTGRKVSDEMIRVSDYCSECVVKKHPYQQGVKARKGVEF